jgi:hypothetical protein
LAGEVEAEHSPSAAASVHERDEYDEYADEPDVPNEPPRERAEPPPSFVFVRLPPRTLRQDARKADVHALAVALMREGVGAARPCAALAEQGCCLAGHLSFQRRGAQARLLAAGAAEVLCGVVAFRLRASTRMVLLSLRALLNLSTCADGQVG